MPSTIDPVNFMPPGDWRIKIHVLGGGESIITPRRWSHFEFVPCIWSSMPHDDCLVSLPGENDNEEIEDDIMTETEDEQDSNEDDDNEVEEEEEEEEEVKAKCARINNDNRRRKKQKMYPVWGYNIAYIWNKQFVLICVNVKMINKK